MNLLFIAVLAGIFFLVLYIIKNSAVDTRITEMEPAQVAELIDKAGYVLIDVREKQEFESGHIKNSVNIPLIELKNTFRELSEYNLVLICQSGSRSFIALSFLKDQGFDNLINLKGGITAWKNAGYSLE